MMDECISCRTKLPPNHGYSYCIACMSGRNSEQVHVMDAQQILYDLIAAVHSQDRLGLNSSTRELHEVCKAGNWPVIAANANGQTDAFLIVAPLKVCPTCNGDKVAQEPNDVTGAGMIIVCQACNGEGVL